MIVKTVAFIVIVFLSLFISLLLYAVPYTDSYSQRNLKILQKSLAGADEICIVTSYAVQNAGGRSYVIIDGRKIIIKKWTVSRDDGIFVGISLKDGQLVDSHPIGHTESEIFMGQRLDTMGADENVTGCKKL